MLYRFKKLIGSLRKLLCDHSYMLMYEYVQIGNTTGYAKPTLKCIKCGRRVKEKGMIM